MREEEKDKPSPRSDAAIPITSLASPCLIKASAIREALSSTNGEAAMTGRGVEWEAQSGMQNDNGGVR